MVFNIDILNIYRKLEDQIKSSFGKSYTGAMGVPARSLLIDNRSVYLVFWSKKDFWYFLNFHKLTLFIIK